MAEFKIGEVAIYIGGGKYHNTEVTITSQLILARHFHCRDGVILNNVYVYYVTTFDGVKIGKKGYHRSALPEHLRKKNPPTRDIDELVNWQDCLWRPSTEKQT